MQISPEGIRLIKSFEGYHTRLPNGDCAAYLCPANVPTIGYGCTEGVRLGMVWTEVQAEAELRRELAKHENAVRRIVTVDMNQNEFDALVSFSYNCGAGALEKSTLLKKLNQGDRLSAAQEFRKWKRGGGRVLNGLVARRERETALFLKPTEAPAEPYMPQQVSKQIEVKPPAVAATGVAVGAGVVESGAVLPALPSPPDLSALSAWQMFGNTLGDIAGWVTGHPILTAFCAAWAAVAWYSPTILRRLGWQQS